MTTSETPPAKRKKAAWTLLGDSIPEPADSANDVIWLALEAYFSFCSKSATKARIAYQTLKMLSILLAAAVTVLAATNARPVVTACFGAAIVVTEGTQQLFKFHTNWLRYRVVTESLREHGILYAAGMAPYDGDAKAAQAKLSTVLQAVIEDERNQWSVQMKPSDAESQ
jgi:hypothetical protein